MTSFNVYIQKVLILIIAFMCFSNCSVNHVPQRISLGPQIFYSETSKCEYLKELDTYLVSVPGLPGVIVSSTDCDLVPGEEIRLVIDMFYLEFVKRFGDPGGKVRAGFYNMVIKLDQNARKVKNLYDTSGKHFDESFVNGLFFSPNVIWVHVLPGSSVADTALVHELMHYALLLSTGDPDPDHEGDKYGHWDKRHTKLISNLSYEIREMLSP